ncbi:MAG: helix-turn-helix domain-containing protein [Desulfobacteraceae bacterium]|nr:helix-turn-helix domain-containing protein [Desulfobacteraceae bacterium]
MDEILTVNEVAHLLRVHPGTVRRWEKKGQLKSYRVGPKRGVIFIRRDIFKFLTNKKGM